MNTEQFLHYLKTASQEKIDELAFKSISKNNKEFLIFLLKNKIVSNPKNTIGQSLLHYSIVYDNKDAFDIIINNRFDPNDFDDEGRTPLHLATLSQNPEYFIKTLLDYGANINALTDKNETPIFFAVYYGKEKAVELLLELGADSTIPNDIGQEPKYFAIKGNNKKIISLLYSKQNQE
jgi:ankyrin repeat protein